MARSEKLYLTEAEIAELVGVPAADWRGTAEVLEKRGLPPRNPLFGYRRYWPAVREFLDRREGVGANSAMQGNSALDGEEERWTYNDQTPARRRGSKSGRAPTAR